MQLCGSLSILWHCLSLGLEWKLTFSSPVATAEFCWHIECSTFTASSFRIWNNSTGIPSPPLALFVVMFPKAHLTSHSRMSGSRWLKTPSWLSGLWRSFLYSSVYCFYVSLILEKAMATHSSTLAWKIPWTEEPGRLKAMGPLRVRHDRVTSLSLFTFMHWRRKEQPTPVFLPGESQGWGAWWAAVYGVAQSQTWLTQLSSSSSSLISSASVRSVPFLSFIEPIFAWNISLVSLIFLKRSLVFPILLFSSISLHWSQRKAFLSLLTILWNSAFKRVHLSWRWSCSLSPVQCMNPIP